MRSLFVLVLTISLLLLAGTATTWLAASGARTARGSTEDGSGAGEARLVGRRGAEHASSPSVPGDGDGTRHGGKTTLQVVGPEDRPHTLADRLRLLADRDTACEEGRDEVQNALRHCEDRVANDLSQPCGVLLMGRERGEELDVNAAPWIDAAAGTFETAFRTPYDVDALYVYGGRLHARVPLADGGTRLVVDPEGVFERTGELELTVRRGDTGDTVADVDLEIRALDRDVCARTDVGLDGEPSRGVRPFRFGDLPAGRYEVQVERTGPPWTYGVATVEVRPGEVTQETVTLGPGASFRMRWFRPDGRPSQARFTTVELRDDGNRLHEVPVRISKGDPNLYEVHHAPTGRCWLVTHDCCAHRLDLRAGDPGPELVVRLQDWAYVVLVVRCEALAPKPLATRLQSQWSVRDDQGVIVEQDRMALTSDTRDDDGCFRSWAHLTPGRYRVRWQLTPDRAVEKAFDVPPGVGKYVVDLDADDS